MSPTPLQGVEHISTATVSRKQAPPFCIALLVIIADNMLIYRCSLFPKPYPLLKLLEGRDRLRTLCNPHTHNIHPQHTPPTHAHTHCLSGARIQQIHLVELREYWDVTIIVLRPLYISSFNP